MLTTIHDVGDLQELLGHNFARDELILVLRERTWSEWFFGVPLHACKGKRVRIRPGGLIRGSFARIFLEKEEDECR